MKKLTIIYSISVFVLTYFTGCTKFRETINGSHNQFDINQSGINQSDIQQEEKQLNEQQLLNPNASAASSDTSVDTTTSEASAASASDASEASIDSTTSDASDTSTLEAAPTVNNKENWSEWTSRQWNKSSTKWISGTVAAVAVVAAGVGIYRKWGPKKVEKIYRFKRSTDGRLNSAGRPLYQRTFALDANAYYPSDDGYTMKWENVENYGVHQANYNNGQKGEIPQAVLDKVRVKQSWWTFWKLG